MIAGDLVSVLDRYYKEQAQIEKSKAVKDITTALQLKTDGKLYVHPKEEYVVRFSYSAKGSFSNTVLALKKLLKYDHLPVLVCLLKPDTYELMLSNTTFLRKISHSSHALTATNIKGSFLGSDIMREVGPVANEPANFEELFAVHQITEQEDNIERLVYATSQIESTKPKFEVDAGVRKKIHGSIRYAFDHHDQIQELKVHLDQKVTRHLQDIVHIAKLDSSNVNLRGNKIEQLITAEDNQHGLADQQYRLLDDGRVMVDIKTSLAGRSSYPKLYNVDKQLKALSDGRTACMIYFVHIDPAEEEVKTYLVNCFDMSMIENTRLQFHWAGRNSRGVTQLDMKIQQYFSEDWEERLHLEKALEFLDQLIDETFR